MALDSDLLAEASAIGDRLADQAIVARDGRATWLARFLPETPTANETYPTLRSLDPTLYSGTAGIALFLARLHGFTDDRRHLAAARGAIRHAIWAVQQPDQGEPWRGGSRFGFYAGVLGVAWAAQELSAPLDDPHLGLQSRRVVARLAKGAAAPHELDLSLGSAGAIPALLRLQEGGNEEAGRLARRLGDDLVAKAHREGDAWSWGRLGAPWPRNLTGLSHGACGVALGLAHLAAATGDDRYRDAAHAGLRYERKHFDPAQKNWPDYRHPAGANGRVSYNNYWCHGAPGIGLSRALLAPLLEDGAMADEARMARETMRAHLRTQLQNPGFKFSLCHGIAGNAECLWLVEQSLGEEGGLALARDAARYGMDRFGHEARQEWGETIEWPTGFLGAQPTLLRGEAGIGYFLLRTLDPARVPTILGPPTAS